MKPRISLSLKATKNVLLTIYCVGVIGLAFPFTSLFFQALIPYSLLMCFVFLALFHQGKPTVRDYIAFLAVLLTGFFVEVLGVNTGTIFGEYVYGKNLGIKVFDTPILIGFNWLFLVYASACMVDTLRLPVWIKVLSASAFMVIYDLIMEQVAPLFDLWSWKEALVPFQNYAAWFVLSLLFHLFFRLVRVSTANSLATHLLVLQLSFFLALKLVYSV